METKTLEVMLASHPFFEGLEAPYFALIAGCASNRQIRAGEYLFNEGDEATHFFILRQGTVAIESHGLTQGQTVIYTHDEGDVVGWSWLFAPYRWHFSGRAMELVRVTALDGVCLRNKCEQDPVLGYELYKRFTQKIVHSLNETRLQLLDIYGVGRKN